MAQTKPLKRPDILNDPNILQKELEENTYNGNVEWDVALDTKNRLDKYNNVKGRLNPTSSGDRVALINRQRESARDSLSLGDTEFDMEILSEFLSPIGRLGHNAKRYSVDFYDKPEEVRNALGYFEYGSEKPIVVKDVKNIDKIPSAYKKLYTANPKNSAFEHEAIHRGLNILYNYYKDNVPSFTKKYGKDTWEFLEKANSFQSNPEQFTKNKAGRAGNPYVEVISEINDGNRAIQDGDTNSELIESFRSRFLGHLNKSTMDEILSKGYKVLPILEKAAMDRLTDKNPTGGITDDAQNMPEESQMRNFSKGGGSVFRIGYSKAEPETLAYYDSAKDELIYIDGGAVEKNPPDNKLTIGLRIGVYKMLGKGQAKGGDVKMDKQMQMVFMDDGMDKDPVSGNDVPTGSLAEEVRDDVPAMLSEGEYVVPADVLRFYGMKFFEDLRTNAKMELARMEAEGRIGGEPVDSKEPIKAAGGITVDNDPIIKLVRAIMKDQPSYSYEEAMHMAKMFYNDRIKELGIIEGRNKGGVIKANTGVTVGGGNMTAEQQAAQAASNASASVTTSAGNTGYTAPIKPPSNEAFMKAVNVGGSSAPKTAKYISSSGALIDVLVGPDGLPLYGAPAGYIKASSPEGQQLMVQFGHSQADPNVATPPETDLEQATPKPKKEKTAAERAAKADAIAARNKNSMKTSAGRIFGIDEATGEVSAENLATYENLSLSERIKLIPKEFSVATGGGKLSNSDLEEIEAMANDKSDGSGLSDLAKMFLPDILVDGVTSLIKGKDKTDTEIPATSSAFKGKITEKDKPYTTQRKTKDGNYVDTIDLDKKAKDDPNFFGTGKSKIYRDSEGDVSFSTPEAITAAEDAFKEDPTAFGNKGMLVTKRTRKPKAKRKSLGQK